MADVKISIGIPTYKSWDRVDQLLTSLYTLTAYPKHLYRVVVIDDGTPNLEVVNKLQEVCKKYDAAFLRNEENRGIPYAWNRLTEYYDAEYVILFNDDIQICSPHWLTCMEYFLDHNEKVGTVGFPLIHIDPSTGSPREAINPESWGSRPGKVGAAVGCCFGFKKSNWAQIQQIDGSIGFPEYYFSFHEEIDLGMEFAKRGWPSYMLHFPPAEHWHSRTFSLNPELAWCQFDERWISKDEYVRWASQCSHTKNFWGTKNGFMTEDGKVDRMSWSRILFAKKWGAPIEEIDNPMSFVHQKYVDAIELMNVKWLDQDLQPREGLI